MEWTEWNVEQNVEWNAEQNGMEQNVVHSECKKIGSNIRFYIPNVLRTPLDMRDGGTEDADQEGKEGINVEVDERERIG